MKSTKSVFMACGVALTLLAAGCGVSHSDVNGEQVSTRPAALDGTVDVRPMIALEGVEDQGGTVVVDELLVHMSEMNLLPKADVLGTDSFSTAPIWAEYLRGEGVRVRGAADVEVPVGDYAVNITLSRSEDMLVRTPSVLKEVSVAVRGVCLGFLSSDGGLESPSFYRGFDPERAGNNPVPMPARPQARSSAGQLMRVPFSFRTTASLNVEVASNLRLAAEREEIVVNLDVRSWLEDAIHPLVLRLASYPRGRSSEGVRLDFADGDQDDPDVTALKLALEESMAGALSAQLED